MIALFFFVLEKLLLPKVPKAAKGKINYANGAWRKIIINRDFFFQSIRMRSDCLFSTSVCISWIIQRQTERVSLRSYLNSNLSSHLFTVFVVSPIRYIMTCCISSHSVRSWIDNRRFKECIALKLSWQLISWVAAACIQRIIEYMYASPYIDFMYAGTYAHFN